MRVGIREAKAKLSNLLKIVQDGTEIIITDRGKPVGKIVSITDEQLPLHERLKMLEQHGAIGPENKHQRKLPPPLRVNSNIQMILREDREDD